MRKLWTFATPCGLDVLDGALHYFAGVSYFPTRTVHLVVVDPGVATARRAHFSLKRKYHFVAPDMAWPLV